LKVDILSIVVKDRGNYIFRLINSVSSIVLWTIVSYFIFLVVQRYLGRPQLSATLKLNMAYMYAAPLVCGIVSIIRYLQDIVRATWEYKALKGKPSIGPSEKKEGI
jgi:TRAP-type C4-dicarboxylate transport system permease small subunit